MILKDGKTFYKLAEIALQSQYSADYLRVRILQGKLKGVKIGRDWHTTREWLDEYAFNHAATRNREVAPGADGGKYNPAVRGKRARVYANGFDFLRKGIFGSFSQNVDSVIGGVAHATPGFRFWRSSLPKELISPLVSISLLAVFFFASGYVAFASPSAVSRVAVKMSHAVGSFVIETNIPRPSVLSDLALASAGYGAERFLALPGVVVRILHDTGKSLVDFGREKFAALTNSQDF